jgi:VWFA-related protein
VLHVGTLVTLTLLLALQAQPTFRAGVDLVVVDVVVVTKNGVPVTDLTATDFTVTAGSRTRRLVSSEFITAPRRGAGAVVSPSPDLPAPSSNQRTTPPGRSVLFVVDVDDIRAGEGRVAMQAIADYANGLEPDARVGLVALPYGTPRVDFTTNRQLVSDAARQITDTSRRSADAEMSPGEAAGINVGDTAALVAWWERTLGEPTVGLNRGCPKPNRRPIEEPTTVPEGCKTQADRTLDVYRRQARNRLDSLRALAESMAPLDGQKAIVLVSEGFYTDPQLRNDVRKFASAAERARVALYALHLDAPLMEAGVRGNTTAGRVLDDRQGFDGMADLALAARGTALRVVAHPAAMLKRIDTELSGYYLLAFERSPDDRDGQHVPIDVRVNRPDLDVRARREFTPAASRGADADAGKKVDPKTAMGALLNGPAATGLPIAVDTYALPLDATSPRVSVMLVADVTTTGRQADVGFEIRDATGKAVADSFDGNADLLPGGSGRVRYAITTTVPPGAYTLLLGVRAPNGQQGKVTHTFVARAWPAGPMRLSEVVLGEVVGNAFRPIARPDRGQDVIAVRVEAHATTATAFSMYTIGFDFTRVGDTAIALTAPARLSGAPDVLRRAATTLVDTRDLPPGDYIVRVRLFAKDGTVTAQSARVLTITR